MVYETPLFGIQNPLFSIRNPPFWYTNRCFFQVFFDFFCCKRIGNWRKIFFWIFTLLCFRYVWTKKTQRFFVCFPGILPHFCFSVCCTLCCVFTKVLYLLQGILLIIYNLFKVFFKKLLTFCKWIWYHKCVHERDFVLKNW